MAPRPLLRLWINHKVHSEYQINVWEDPWILSIPAIPAKSIHLVLDSRVTVSEIIHGTPNIWDVEQTIE